jgi:5-deoxy-glucuronate isomerase
MTDLIVPSREASAEGGSVVKVTPQSAGWEYVGFEVLRLAAGQTAERRADGVEVCLVPVSGGCHVATDADEWRDVGEREGPFDGLPHAIYLPPGTTYRVEAATDLELAVASAPAERGAGRSQTA